MERVFTKAEVIKAVANANSEKYMTQLKLPCANAFKEGAKFGFIDTVADVKLLVGMTLESGSISKDAYSSLMDKIDNLNSYWNF